MLKYVVPLYLLTIFVCFCWEKLPSRDVDGVHQAGYIETISDNQVAFTSVMFIGVVLVFLLLMVHIAGRRWEAQGRLPKAGD